MHLNLEVERDVYSFVYAKLGWKEKIPGIDFSTEESKFSLFRKVVTGLSKSLII